MTAFFSRGEIARARSIGVISLLALGCHSNSITGTATESREASRIASTQSREASRIASTQSREASRIASTESAAAAPAACVSVPFAKERSDSLPPLVGPWLVELARHGQTEDVVTLPLGTTELRPVVVAVHGAGDNPNWACGGWRIGVESFAFVACPGGLPMGAKIFGWSGTQSIRTAVERTLSELRARFGSYWFDGPMIYAGFSQGAILAAPFLVENAARFPVAAIAEGGYDYIADPKFAHDYRAAGGTRIMLLCGTGPCFTTARRAQTVLEKAGLVVIVAGDHLSGHNLNERMQNALRKEWSNLVEGLPGWASFEQHRWPAPER
ncbi:MAG: hypothetical protein QM784_33605 [Polyangiaceae bacterium]